MEQPPDPLDKRAQLAEAMAKLKAAPSMAHIMKQMSKVRGLDKIARSTAFRWLQKTGDYNFHRDTMDRIILAAKALSSEETPPMVIPCATIQGASEMIPLLLLKESLPHITRNVKFDLAPKKTISECFKALRDEDDPAVLMVAPRQDLSPSDPVQRLCKIVEIDVSGIFVGEHNNSIKLAESLRKQKKAGTLRCATLVNADYSTILRNFVNRSYDESPPITVDVRTYKKAFDMLRVGSITGAIGHKVFIDNLFWEIRKHLKTATSEERARLEGLHIAPNNSFSCVKMDIFVNVKKIDRTVARTAIGMIYEAIEEIHNPPKREAAAFYDTVSGLLNLKRARKSGRDVLNEFKFEMKTFVTPTLLQLWKG